MKIDVLVKFRTLLLRTLTKKTSMSGRKKMKSLQDFLVNLNIDRLLDLGSGPILNNRYSARDIYGVDLRVCDASKKVFQCNLSSEKLPFEDDFFDCITAFDLLEHIPRFSNCKGSVGFPFVELMNEVWRCLQSDGLFISCTPCFPFPEAFQDPTHVNIMTEDTLEKYFGLNAWGRIYGFYGTFETVEEFWNGTHFVSVMKKMNKKEFDVNGAQC